MRRLSEIVVDLLRLFRPLRWGILVVAFVILVPLVFVNMIMLQNAAPKIAEGMTLGSREYAVVLGAGVRGQRLSAALKNRMDKAIELNQRGVVRKILLSGGVSPFYNETSAMQKYAISKGVAPAAIFADLRGYSTFESIERARRVFDVTSAYLISQEFHLARVVWLANHMGIEAQGISVGQLDEFWFYSVREFFARPKDMVQFYLSDFNQESSS